MNSIKRVGYLIFASILALRVGAQENSTQPPGWSDSSWAFIEPSAELAWTKCYDGSFECGRFQVPLNYSDPEGNSAAIALIRIKANVSADSPEYLGPILINPGGPGVSGVDFVIQRAELFKQVIGPQFDIVGFDPRGIRHSTPRVELFKSREERALWFRPAIKELNHSSDNVASFWARNKINGQLAEERLINLLPYITTSHVAQDMLHIVEAYGREKLQYWGFSAGSILGSTFAAMFPDKVERLIIDAVVDAENDYYTTEWKFSTLDTDKALNWFFKDCHNAGPEVCAFYDTSPEAMWERLNRLYESIIRSPVAVRTETSYGLVDYEFLRQAIFLDLDDPFALWPALATGLADLEAGNGTAIWKTLEEPPFRCSCDPTEYAFEANFPEVELALICNDGDVVPPSLEEAERHYKESVAISGWNSLYATMRISCSSWPRISKDFFRGPISGNTSYPLLIIGNVADSVTSIRNAHVVSKGFPGSVVLTQDSAGHGSLVSPSVCTAKTARAYFVNGTLPEPGTICPIDGNPFDTINSTSESTKRELSEAGYNEEDIALLHTLRRLAGSPRRRRRGVFRLSI